MKTINIADQPRLSFGRTVQITVDGIRYRLFRASVTVAVIAVAVAFLTNILTESLVKRAVARQSRARIENARLVDNWMARLTAPGTAESIFLELAHSDVDGARCREAARLGGLTPAEVVLLHAGARRAVAYLGFFSELDYAQRREMAHTATGIGIFDRLATPEGLRTFREALKDLKSLRFPSNQDRLEDFLSGWPAVKAAVARVRDGRVGAIRKVTAARGERTIIEALADAAGAFGATVRAAGFEFDAERTAPEVARQAQQLLDARRLERSLDNRLARQAIAQHYNLLPADVNMMLMWSMLSSRKGATVYLERMQVGGLDVAGLTPERLTWLADAREDEAALVQAERLTSDMGAGWLGLGERMGWLLAVSMLVCGIGIANAMLMSVTERFQEIATLKCLGALDGFIMAMFVLESSVLGLVGGAFGTVLGGVIGMGRMMVAFGFRVFGSLPVADLAVGMVVAVVVGVLLAALAAVYPSFKAARLAPMEAMRIE